MELGVEFGFIELELIKLDLPLGLELGCESCCELGCELGFELSLELGLELDLELDFIELESELGLGLGLQLIFFLTSFFSFVANDTADACTTIQGKRHVVTHKKTCD